MVPIALALALVAWVQLAWLVAVVRRVGAHPRAVHYTAVVALVLATPVGIIEGLAFGAALPGLVAGLVAHALLLGLCGTLFRTRANGSWIELVVGLFALLLMAALVMGAVVSVQRARAEARARATTLQR